MHTGTSAKHAGQQIGVHLVVTLPVVVAPVVVFSVVATGLLITLGGAALALAALARPLHAYHCHL